MPIPPWCSCQATMSCLGWTCPPAPRQSCLRSCCATSMHETGMVSVLSNRIGVLSRAHCGCSAATPYDLLKNRRAPVLGWIPEQDGWEDCGCGAARWGPHFPWLLLFSAVAHHPQANQQSSPTQEIHAAPPIQGNLHLAAAAAALLCPQCLVVLGGAQVCSSTSGSVDSAARPLGQRTRTGCNLTCAALQRMAEPASKLSMRVLALSSGHCRDQAANGHLCCLHSGPCCTAAGLGGLLGRTWCGMGASMPACAHVLPPGCNAKRWKLCTEPILLCLAAGSLAQRSPTSWTSIARVSTACVLPAVPVLHLPAVPCPPVG